jgi:predicted nucleotidyltransferase
MLTKNDILKFLRDNKYYLSKEFHIKKIGLFGSYARDEAAENSDIDLLIELEENTPDIFELKRNLRMYIKDNLKRDVHICREKYLKSFIKEYLKEETVYV